MAVKMESIPFSKYHGLGNNFIFVDNRKRIYDLNDRELVKSMCDVKTGIGADCLLEIRNCEHGDHTNSVFEMVTHRCDGTIGAFCGNGGRCSIKYASQLGIVRSGHPLNFCGFDGEHKGFYDVNTGLVHVGMRDINAIKQYDSDNYFLFTGTPVHVMYVNDVARFDVQTVGDEIRFNRQRYPEGANVMFVELNDVTGRIIMRSYERGMDGETSACGTGSVGAALTTHFRQNKFDGQTTFALDLEVRLGNLRVKATRRSDTLYTDVSLIGPASHVFDGTYRMEPFKKGTLH